MIPRLAVLLTTLPLLTATADVSVHTIKFGKFGKEVPDDCDCLSGVHPYGATKYTDRGLALSYHAGPDDKIKDANKHGKVGGVRLEFSSPRPRNIDSVIVVYAKDRSLSRSALCLHPSGSFMQRGSDVHGSGSHGYQGTFLARGRGKFEIWTKGDGDYLIEKIDIIIKDKHKPKMR